MSPDQRRVVLRAVELLAVVVVAIVLVTTLSPKATPTDYRAEGDPRPLPTSQLAAVDAEEFAGILVGLRGTPVIVNVWASWCAPCRVEMPLLQRAAEEFESEVVFLGVASRDSSAEAGEFLDEVGVSYPSVFDGDGSVRRALGLRGFPTTYVFDASGDLREAIVGGVSEQRLAAQLQDLVD